MSSTAPKRAIDERAAGDAPVLGAIGGASGELIVRPRAIALTAITLFALWMLDIFVLRTGLLANYEGAHALTPLYAFWKPRALATTVLFPVAFAVFAIVSDKLCDPVRTKQRAFVLCMFVAAIVLPFALFLVRDEPSQLGAQFTIYPDEEFFHDAAKIREYSGFLAHYVELMPRLSVHGQHFPPGHASLLYWIAQVFGSSTLAAGIAVLAIFAVGIVAAFAALREIASGSAPGAPDGNSGERGARQATCLLLAAPSMLDFACTSMDAVFFSVAAITLWLALRAFRENARWFDALVCGVALLVAAFFSFSTLPLGFAIASYALVSGRKRIAQTLQRLALVGAAFVASALLLKFATGFALWEALFEARSSAAEFMGQVTAGRAGTDRLHLSFGNVVAFAIGSGAALTTVAIVAVKQHREKGREKGRDWTLAALVALATMTFAPIYYMETERIWMFAIPWVAALAIAGRAIEACSFRTLLVVGAAQALAMEIVLFTLW